MRTFINKSFHKSTYKPSYTYSKAAAHCLEFTIHWTYRTNISVVHNLQYQNQSLTLVNQSLVNERSKRNFSYGNNTELETIQKTTKWRKKNIQVSYLLTLHFLLSTAKRASCFFFRTHFTFVMLETGE